MPFCKSCDAFHLESEKHVCPPLWEARIFNTKYQEDWVEVNGIDPEVAASRFCELYDRGGDYDIIKRGGEEIEIRKPGSDAIIRVNVTAESVPEYYGRVVSA